MAYEGITGVELPRPVSTHRAYQDCLNSIEEYRFFKTALEQLAAKPGLPS